jgi:hypothetical protein
MMIMDRHIIGLVVAAVMAGLVILGFVAYVRGQPIGTNTTLAIRPTSSVAVLGTTCTAAQRGQMYMVTDQAAAPVALAVVAGAGAVTVGVTCNGANWIIE